MLFEITQAERGCLRSQKLRGVVVQKKFVLCVMLLLLLLLFSHYFTWDSKEFHSGIIFLVLCFRPAVCVCVCVCERCVDMDGGSGHYRENE